MNQQEFRDKVQLQSGPEAKERVKIGVAECVIVMPVHNALPYVKRTVEFIKKDPYHRPLVIVDDASDAETLEYLKSVEEHDGENPGDGRFIKVLRNNRQQLFTRTVNRGLRYARKTFPATEYMIVLNSDVDLFEGWEQGLLKILKFNPNIGKVAYRDSTEPNLQDAWEEVKFPGYLTGHCFAVPTKILEEVGVLCESDVGGAECVFPELAHLKGLAHIGSDRHLTYRIQNAGYKTVYSNYPGCGHEAGKSWGHNLNWLFSFNLDPLWPANDHITS